MAIRQLLADDRPAPMAGTSSRLEIAVFVSGHTHAPAMSELARADGRRTAIVNTGCWLRQLQAVADLHQRGIVLVAPSQCGWSQRETVPAALAIWPMSGTSTCASSG